MAQGNWIIKELLKVSAEYLREKGLENPRLSAEVLLAHHLKVDRVRLYLDLEKPLQEEELAGYRSLIRRRGRREPLQYITGLQGFWSAELSVRPGVLIPRPESELLVEQALEILRSGDGRVSSKPRILDLGTGSGALIIALGREVPEALLWASDLSVEALAVARENAVRHGLERKIEFLEGDFLGPSKEKGLAYDLILSNPPYVASEEMANLMPEVQHEPRCALDGGRGGMECIERILREAPDSLVPGGWLLIEMDPRQVPTALGLIAQSGRYGESRAAKDYTRRNRVIVARRIQG
jgi:release factor glutamine methyltransferase